MENTKTKIVTAVGTILIIGAIFGMKYVIDLLKYKKTIAEIKINNVNLNKAKDGSYIGEFNANFLASKVNVKVRDHKIIDIIFIKHKYDRGKPAEAIISKVIAEQSLKVDTVSGATNSSKVILKSIENALSQDQE
jgi:uncharacterized protein with FMN-binding domain